jgi:hypothetical protein
MNAERRAAVEARADREPNRELATALVNVLDAFFSEGDPNMAGTLVARGVTVADARRALALHRRLTEGGPRACTLCGRGIPDDGCVRACGRCIAERQG